MAKPVKIKKWGNSLAIRIPYYVAHQLGIKEGDQIHMLVNHNVVTLTVPISEQNAYDMAVGVDDLT